MSNNAAHVFWYNPHCVLPFATDPQTIGGQWRTKTFNAIESRPFDASEITTELVMSIEKSVIALLDAVFGTSAWGRKEDVNSGQLDRIVQQAYEWNKKVKSTSIDLDFDPCIAGNDAPFDHVSMAIGKNTTTPTSIICAVNSGLMTSEARGGGMPPIYRWLEKMRVELPQWVACSTYTIISVCDLCMLS